MVGFLALGVVVLVVSNRANVWVLELLMLGCLLLEHQLVVVKDTLLYDKCGKHRTDDCWRISGACFGCGDRNHKVADYLKYPRMGQGQVAWGE